MCKELVGEWKRLAHGLAREDWQELSAGTGSKGPRLFAWARIELAAPEISGWQHWLLVCRSLDEGTKLAEMAYVLVFGPDFHLFREDDGGFRCAASRWSSVLRKPKEKWAWMSTKSAAF
jgi:hypothetical protein